MEEDIKGYKLGNKIEEFEELFGNVPIDDIDKIKKYLVQNYIPKSKIEREIEEIKETLEFVKTGKDIKSKIQVDILERIKDNLQMNLIGETDLLPSKED